MTTSTTTISDFGPLNNIVTPEFDKKIQMMDADDELLPVAEYIKTKTDHNSYIDPLRIKFLYTRKAKKEGGRYILGGLTLRDEMERMVNKDYDYIVSVYYPVWKDLDIENRIIQLDKIICGIDVSNEEKPGKNQKDSREHVRNLKHYGIKKVIDSTEMVHLAIATAVEKQKEEDKKIKITTKKTVCISA